MSSSSNQPFSSSSSLEPTLYTVLPESLHTSFTSHLSLNSIHIEELETVDRIYTTSNPIIPGQLRNLRFRSRKLPSGSVKGKQKQQEEDGWIHSLTYISAPLRGQEYSQASTKAVIGINILSLEEVDDIVEFITSLGFDHSHTYQSKGQLFHIPIPTPTNSPLTLQISITHLTPLDSPHDPERTSLSIKSNTGPDKGDPWLIQLYPSRPVNAVSINGDLNYSTLVEIMRDFVSGLGVGALRWTTGSR